MSDPAQPSQLTKLFHRQLSDLAAEPPSMAQLEKSLRLLAKWRSMVIGATIAARDGKIVQHGPFKGMTYEAQSSEGSLAARLLGGYEASLFPIVEGIIAADYETVIDVGCADGYYAVGFARRMPQARILAFDSNPTAREKARAVAEQNGVLDRVEIGAEANHATFGCCEQQRSLVFCDIEGGEKDLLDPALAPGLLAADILVESHEIFAPGLTAMLTKRFQPTHEVTRIGRQLDGSVLPEWMEELSDLDRLIALWEWRLGPTPWLWMTRK